MKQLDYGKDYRYAHNEDKGYAAGESYMPEEMDNKQYYFPTDRGLEVKIAEKIRYLRTLDKKSRDNN
jgi:putative ATPase